MNHYIYTNHGTFFPKGVLFECDAEDILAADKLFTEKMGKKMSDKECAYVLTYSPDWRKAVSEFPAKLSANEIAPGGGVSEETDTV